MNKGQSLVEYALICVLVIIVVLAIVTMIAGAVDPKTPCEKSSPTAGDIIYCVATRTAEAKTR